MPGSREGAILRGSPNLCVEVCHEFLAEDCTVHMQGRTHMDKQRMVTLKLKSEEKY